MTTTMPAVTAELRPLAAHEIDFVSGGGLVNVGGTNVNIGGINVNVGGPAITVATQIGVALFGASIEQLQLAGAEIIKSKFTAIF